MDTVLAGLLGAAFVVFLLAVGCDLGHTADYQRCLDRHSNVAISQAKEQCNWVKE
jgi:hypothetical protein